MKKLNCWEYNNCGREPGGRNVEKHGACPTTTDRLYTGTNGGTKAGRACWIVSGSFSTGKKHCLLAQGNNCCTRCDIFKTVKKEREKEALHKTILTRL